MTLQFNLERGANLKELTISERAQETFRQRSLAGKVWRVGLMGYASNRKNVLFCLGALEAALNRSGGVSAARSAL